MHRARHERTALHRRRKSWHLIPQPSASRQLGTLACQGARPLEQLFAGRSGVCLPDLLDENFLLRRNRMCVLGEVAGKTTSGADRLSRLLVITVSIGFGHLRLMTLTFNTSRFVS